MDYLITELDLDDDYLEYCQLLKQLTVLDIELITSENFKNHLKLIKSNSLHKIIIMKNDNKIIATITILIEPKFIHNLSYVAHIEDVVVDPNYRSLGIGSLLVKRALEISKDCGCYKVILDCCEENIPFYQKNGFKLKEKQMAIYL